MTRLISKGLISVATASVLMTSFTGCMDSKSTTGSETQTKQATGSVVGLVQDTNGNALTGVTVYLAGKQTTTDAGGIYRFDKVPVTNVAGGDANTGHAALSITIAAPTGYLGATVTVTPMAQIDDAEDNGAGSTVANGTETFIDGFLAEAGVAVLPALTATVTGRLEVATTQADVESYPLSLDLVSVNAIAQQQAQNGVTTTYATGSYSATTDAHGDFTFTNVPADSVLNVVVGGSYTIGATTATTTGEDEILNLGDITATPVVNSDVVGPYVTSITGQISGAANPVMLEDDVRQTIVVNFSEPIALLSENDTDMTNSVNVYDKTNSVYLSQTATISGNQLTIVLDTALGDNINFDINMLITDFKDEAGNFAQLDVPATVAYDSLAATSQVLRLNVNSYNDLNENAVAVTNSAQMTTDATGTDATVNNIDLQAHSVAFNDVNDADGAVFSQLNGSNAAEATLTAARLDALGDALTAGATTVLTDEARVTFTPSGATSYTVTVKTSTGAAKAGLTAIGTRTSSNVAAITDDVAAADNVATLTLTDANNAEFVVEGVIAGDTVTITPNDDFGYAGTAAVIALADNVAPTTVLQKSYLNGATTAGHNGGSTVVKYGDGGELSDTSGAVTVGTPYLAINNSLLDNLTAAGAAVSNTDDGDETLEKELFQYNTVNTTTSTPYIAGKGTYDITAWGTFNTDTSLAREIGVAFSEDVSLNGVTPSYNGTASLTAFNENNDVTVNVDNTAINADLINMTASNVLTLANTDNGSVIDYTGIADETGNVAGADAAAKVVIDDKMAPFVTKAEYNGEGVEVTFNEPIQLTVGTTQLVIKAADGSLTGATLNTGEDTNNTWALSNSNMTLTVLPGDFNDTTMTLRTTNDWNLSTYAYTADSYGVGSTIAVDHAYLDFSAVEDANGNSWDTYAASVRASALVAAPSFAIANTVGEFTVTANSTNFTVAATTTAADQTVVWTFAHPILVATAADIFFDADANNTDGTMDYTTASKVNTWFNYIQDDNGTELNLTGGNLHATLSADKKQITLVFQTPVDANTTDCYVKEVSTNVVTSAWDTTKTANAFTANAQ